MNPFDSLFEDNLENFQYQQFHQIDHPLFGEQLKENFLQQQDYEFEPNPQNNFPMEKLNTDKNRKDWDRDKARDGVGISKQNGHPTHSQNHRDTPDQKEGGNQIPRCDSQILQNSQPIEAVLLISQNEDSSTQEGMREEVPKKRKRDLNRTTQKTKNFSERTRFSISHERGMCNIVHNLTKFLLKMISWQGNPKFATFLIKFQIL